ncbi:hypothetical protein KFE25_002102 [Diacronema lutheri]|uniref:Procollagen-proline 4-dioxygenase n=1 Tax=Diacronema lutheri TaxID=2081491 RepID=A0A8J5XCV3_DIALT|nr:hypothetical protein KFE25_002102 [Diacronema lutheri]
MKAKAPSGGASRARHVGALCAAACALLAARHYGLGLSGVQTLPLEASGESGGARDVEPGAIAAHVRQVRVDAASALPCDDTSTDCVAWARSGECSANPAFMLEGCKASCGLCGAERDARTPSGSSAPPADECKDLHDMCATWASIGECNSNPSFMTAQCRVACRLCQSADCRDSRDDCAELARDGGCYSRASMRRECAWTCVSCAARDVPKCARDRSIPPAAVRGSVETLFSRLAAMPSTDGSAASAVRVHSASPWVVTIDNFLSPAEADALLAAGGTDWTRSLAGDGVQQVRTSSTSWCRARCLEDETVQAVQRRVEALTGVPVENAEYMQVLRYEPGQFYKVHHDQNSPRASAWGPRLYTFFMYLSDVEAGGGTHFPRLNITVEPAKGRALLWTSVLDEDPYERDDRTDHEALDVIAGVKYAANYWLHMFPFRSISDLGCDNAPYMNNWV